MVFLTTLVCATIASEGVKKAGPDLHTRHRADVPVQRGHLPICKVVKHAVPKQVPRFRKKNKIIKTNITGRDRAAPITTFN